MRFRGQEELGIRQPVLGRALSRAVVCVDATDVQGSSGLQLGLHMRVQARNADATLPMLELRSQMLKTTRRDR
jgi:hypothetical protein